MRFQLTSVLAIVSATLAIASPTCQAESEKAGSKVQRQETDDDGSPRPTVTCSPIQPRLPPPVHGKRTKICHVRYHHQEWEAASDFVMDAMQKCNNGGHVIFSPNITYTIGQALDLTFLKNIDIGMPTFWLL
jgi:galacturan 1,4-alpha-galacturonidase